MNQNNLFPLFPASLCTVRSNICQYLYQDLFFIHVENHIIIFVLLRKKYTPCYLSYREIFFHIADNILFIRQVGWLKKIFERIFLFSWFAVGRTHR